VASHSLIGEALNHLENCTLETKHVVLNEFLGLGM
jgi:hypothetical protein